MSRKSDKPRNRSSAPVKHSTKLDLVVRDDAGGLVRPTVTIIMDPYNGVVLGWNVDSGSARIARLTCAGK